MDQTTVNSDGCSTSFQSGDTGCIDDIRHFLHDVQALPVLSGALMSHAREGESYEALVRQLTTLHLNLSEYAERAWLLSVEGIDVVLNEGGRAIMSEQSER